MGLWLVVILLGAATIRALRPVMDEGAGASGPCPVVLAGPLAGAAGVFLARVVEGRDRRGRRGGPPL